MLFEVLWYDPHRQYDVQNDQGCISSLQELSDKCDGPIFICVPTPMNPDGACDVTIVESVVAEINNLSQGKESKPVLVIKSTVVPSTTERFNAKYQDVLCVFNPEFLTEAASVEDFKNQDRIIIGGPHKGTSVVKSMYQKAYPLVPTTKTSSIIAEMVKYVTNSFLAVKVSFANEISQICQELNIDYDKVIEYATKDKRLGMSHWSVPGPDGMVGWGGKCFPKDLNSLMALARQLDVLPKVMEGAWLKNLEVRTVHDWDNIPGAVNKA